MKEMGITWENVVPACRREYKKHCVTPPASTPYAPPAPSGTYEDVEPPLVERVLESSTPEPQTDASVSDDSDCCDCEERPVPLELVLAELKRRLPGASITITIA